MRSSFVTLSLLAVFSGCAHWGETGPPMPTGYPGADPVSPSAPPSQSPVRAPECTTDADCSGTLPGRPGWSSRCVNAHCTQ
jgi:hypothetical protein